MPMQLQSELEMQVGHSEAEAASGTRRKPVRARKMTVRLTEELYNRLCTASDRPGVGKSILVEAALEHFLKPAPLTEEVIQERFDDMDVRFDRLERDVRMIAETIALHARYHFAVMPPLPQSRQHDAVRLADERFKVLAEQVDRRVQMDQPLMQETINRLKSTDQAEPQATPSKHDVWPPSGDQGRSAENAEANVASSAAAKEGGSNSYFRHLWS